MKKGLIASSIALAFGAQAAQAALVMDIYGPYAWSTDSANFTRLDDIGGTVDGTNDVKMDWDGNGYSDSSDYTGPGGVSNVTVSSTSLLFNHTWTAHDIQIFTPGSYSFDVTLGGGVSEVGILDVTVASGQLGMHMLWDWNGGLNNDIFMVLAPSSVFGAGIGRSTQSTTSGGNLCDNGTTRCHGYPHGTRRSARAL